MSKTFYDIDRLDGHPEVAAALGNMVIAWANAETAILFAMAEICNLPTNMAHFGYFRIPTFEARVKFMQAMIPEWDTKLDKEAISAAIENISKLAATRNGWIHGIWSEEKGPRHLVVFNFRAAENKGRSKPVKAHDILHHTETLRTRTAELRKLIPGRP